MKKNIVNFILNLFTTMVNKLSAQAITKNSNTITTLTTNGLQTLEIGTHSINLSTYASGLYLLKAESNGAINTMRLIKE